MTSILTNNAAKVALQTLTQTMQSLETTQNRISTGLRIGSAADNAAYWAIATTMRSDSSSLSTVSDALNLGATTVDTASNGLNKAIDVVKQIKDKLISAATPGQDRAKIQSDIKQLQSQLKSIADGASFNGQNWLSVDSSAAGYNATKSIVASFSRNASGDITVGTINVDINDIKLFDSGGSGDFYLAASNFGPVTTGTGTVNAATGAVAAGVVTLTSTIRTSATTDATQTITIDLSTLSITTPATAANGTVTDNMALAAGDRIGATATYDATAKTLTIKKIDVDVINSTYTAPKYVYSTWTITNVTLGDSTGGGLLDAVDTTTVGSYTDANGVTTTTTAGTGKSVYDLDISSLTDSAADLAMLNAFTNQVDKAIQDLTSAASDLGSVKSRITLQQSFVTSLKDSIDKGIGALVDADMNEESTRLQALQVQQQLGVQALSIANQSTQAILRLFQ